MAQERSSAATFKGNPLTLIGPELKTGQPAPEFHLTANDLSTVTLATSAGKTRLISVVPSLDTPICDEQTRRFNREAAKLPGDIAVLTVSMDLPFAQKRWCGAAGVEKVQTLSDYKDHSFGPAYGVRIKELGLLARAIVIVDPGNTIRYVEYVKEVTNHPNYDAALDALKTAVR